MKNLTCLDCTEFYFYEPDNKYKCKLNKKTGKPCKKFNIKPQTK